MFFLSYDMLEDIPYDIWYFLCFDLSPNDICNLMLCSKKMYNKCDDIHNVYSERFKEIQKYIDSFKKSIEKTEFHKRYYTIESLKFASGNCAVTLIFNNNCLLDNFKVKFKHSRNEDNTFSNKLVYTRSFNNVESLLQFVYNTCKSSSMISKYMMFASDTMYKTSLISHVN